MEARFCLGAVLGFFLLQLWAIGEKLELTTPWVDRFGLLGLLAVLSCLGVRAILDDHYILDFGSKTITFRRRLCWIPVWSERVADFENLHCLSVLGATVDEHGKVWGYGVLAYTREGVSIALLTVDKTVDFEKACALASALSSMIGIRIHPEPQAERILTIDKQPHRLWRPDTELYYQVIEEETKEETQEELNA